MAKTIKQRVSALEEAFAEMQAWRAEMEGPDEPVVEVPTLPSGYRKVQDYGIDYMLQQDWGNIRTNIYLPNWQQGPHSVGNPSLIAWNDDGSATIDAVARLHTPTGKTWQTGALQFNRPKLAKGRAGAIIHVTDPSAVAAFFGHDSKTGKEVDFELTWKDGSAGYAPAVHMRRANGQMSHSSRRVMARAPLADRPQVLEYDLQADRCDFYCDRILFETIRPADMDDPSAWDTTLGMSQHCAIEKHGGWAGWDYASGKAQMIVHALKVEAA